ncbi:hypothetical protein PMI01_03085 [Caulobacter sp. AP07]|uniref:DUF1801 domain-containing protein n=1 Tax=Caulobacter sp. AP07 TaxID=1144304 RepID=UPI000271F2CB|nr:DUF1801 domain-containing protein [Caulobacter sp. AP07]EJL30693.1 hypothetical protein PMI01_03085 [Caulobacter sp. AP07]
MGRREDELAAPIDVPEVRAFFDSRPPPLRDALLGLRGLILATAAQTPGVGVLVETLKWGEPAYRPKAPRTGTTVRINAVKGSPDRYAAYFHCQTTLVESFRLLYPDQFRFEGARALILSLGEPVPEAAFRHCVALALTYNLAGRGQ